MQLRSAVDQQRLDRAQLSEAQLLLGQLEEDMGR